MEYPSNAKIVRVPCSGRIDPLLVLHAFRNDADGVIVVSCRKENCHHVTGSERMRQQIKKLKRALDIIGLDGNRVDTCFVSSAMAFEFVATVSEFTEKVRRIGPNPLRRFPSSK